MQNFSHNKYSELKEQKMSHLQKVTHTTIQAC